VAPFTPFPYKYPPSLGSEEGEERMKKQRKDK